MTEPLSREARGLLTQAVSDEGALRADAARRARLKQTLLSGLAASSAGLVAGTTEAAVGVKAASGAVSLVKGLAVGLLVSGGIAGGFRLALSSNAEAPKPAASSAGAPEKAESVKLAGAVQAADASPRVDEAPPAAPASVDVSAPGKARVAALASSTEREPPRAAKPAESAALALRAELAFMSEVQAALRDNQGARALALIERYDSSFAQGQLLRERLAAEVFAACQLGNVARAQRAAAQFLSRDASSPLAARVKGACIDAEQAR